MLARGDDVIAIGCGFDHLDVGSDGRARKQALEQVVTQYRVLGYAALQRGLEGVDVIQPLAGVGALATQILVHVRDCERVRIDAGGPGQHDLYQRGARGTCKRWRNARLQNSVALPHPSA